MMSDKRKLLIDARAEALFVSTVPTGAKPATSQLAAEISRAIRYHHGSRGCAAEMAYAYGEDPVRAAIRMRWARETVLGVYATNNVPATPAQRRPGSAGRERILSLAPAR